MTKKSTPTLPKLPDDISPIGIPCPPPNTKYIDDLLKLPEVQKNENLKAALYDLKNVKQEAWSLKTHVYSLRSLITECTLIEKKETP